MFALVAEVDQARNVEHELNEIVQHQQDQAQTVQAGRHNQAPSETLQRSQRINKRIITLSTAAFLRCQHLLENVGAGDVGQVQEDIHKLTWNILLNGKNKRTGGQEWSKYLQQCGSAWSFQQGEYNYWKQ